MIIRSFLLVGSMVVARPRRVEVVVKGDPRRSAGTAARDRRRVVSIRGEGGGCRVWRREGSRKGREEGGEEKQLAGPRLGDRRFALGAKVGKRVLLVRKRAQLRLTVDAVTRRLAQRGIL